MSNFRLHVFYAVATHLNFTKAAEELFITQPAVTKNIKELESEYNISLFDRTKGRISLTEAGNMLLKHCEKTFELEKELRYNFSTINDTFAGQLKIGASTTIGQYILPEILANFKNKYNDVQISLFNDNTHKIESATANKEIEVGIVEGKSTNTQLKYIPFIKDEIVAVAHPSQPVAQLDEITIEQLKTIPIALREVGSGSLDVIADRLRKHKISLNDLNVSINLGSTESIKSYLYKSNCIGLISIHAVSREIANGEFKIIEIQGLEINRTFHFIHLHGHLSGFSKLFIDFATTNHNLKL